MRYLVPRRLDRYIAISRNVQQKLMAALKEPRAQTTLIPNALDLVELESAPRADLSIPPKFRLRIISVGRLVPEKGYQLLLKAFADALKHSFAELCILGEGPEKERLESLAIELRLADKLIVPGYVSKPYAWLKSADIFVSSSRWETFGIAIAKAMALGVPVVATETEGAMELIETGVNGVLVPVSDGKALGRAILELARSPGYRRRLAERAREQVKQFDTAFILPRYEHLIETLITE